MKWLIAPIVVSVLVVAISFGCERPGYGNRLAQEHAGRAIAVMARHTARLGKALVDSSYSCDCKE